MTETDQPEFRHKIGDCLYELYTPYESNDAPDEVIMWPVIKMTDRYVWVRGARFYDEDKTFRFSRDDLEVKGRAWNQSQRQALYVRPLPGWPLLVVSVTGARAIDAPMPLQSHKGDMP